MWSPDPSRRILLGLAGALLATGALGACQVRPVYAPVEGIALGVQADLSGIDVMPVDGRTGQKLRNDLQFLFSGGDVHGGKYEMYLRVKSKKSNLLVRVVSDKPRAQIVTLTASYELRRKGGEDTLVEGSFKREASLEWSDQRYANDRAAIDAENRAARELAEDIRTHIAAWFAAHPKEVQG